MVETRRQSCAVQRKLKVPTRIAVLRRTGRRESQRSTKIFGSAPADVSRGISLLQEGLNRPFPFHPRTAALPLISRRLNTFEPLPHSHPLVSLRLSLSRPPGNVDREAEEKISSAIYVVRDIYLRRWPGRLFVCDRRAGVPTAGKHAVQPAGMNRGVRCGSIAYSRCVRRGEGVGVGGGGGDGAVQGCWLPGELWVRCSGPGAATRRLGVGVGVGEGEGVPEGWRRRAGAPRDATAAPLATIDAPPYSSLSLRVCLPVKWPATFTP